MYQRLLTRNKAPQQQQQARYNGPYESYLEDKHGIDLEAIEGGISGQSRKSGKSGISAASANSGEPYVAGMNLAKSHQNANN